VLFNFIPFLSKWFTLAVAAVSAELIAICCTKFAKFYNFCAYLLLLRTTANSAQNTARAESQNSDIPNYTVEMYASVAQVHFGFAMTLTFDLWPYKIFSTSHSHDEYLCQVSLKSLH